MDNVLLVIKIPGNISNYRACTTDKHIKPINYVHQSILNFADL